MFSEPPYTSSSNNNRSNRRRALYPGFGSGNIAYVGTFRAYSMGTLGRSSLEIGDKIILPQNTLQSINRLRLPFPLIFEIRKYNNNLNKKENSILNIYKKRIETIYRSTNPSKMNKISSWLNKYNNNPHELYLKICKMYSIIPKSKVTSSYANCKQYCSVYEFSSPSSDSAYIPSWMINNIGINEGDKIEIQSQFNIKKGIYCKLQPYKQSFLNKISTIGYKETLESSLRYYSVLSINQRIVVEFNHIPYQCIIKECKPDNVISILGSTDLEIEFDEALEIDDESTSLNDIDELNDNTIDGKLLKQLGIPLDYIEQTNLAQMIIENRKLEEENNQLQHISLHNSDNDIDTDTDTDTDIDSDNNDDKDKDVIIGVNDIKCNNCSKYINSMSIQMHEIHCQRNFIKCKLCDIIIKKDNESQDNHFNNIHREYKCLCNITLIGNNKYSKHLQKECKLRLKKCKYCLSDNIISINYKKHLLECASKEIICNICNKKYINKNQNIHDCGVLCVLCGTRILLSSDKLLHLLTSCTERRAVCDYCGILRKCNDMEQHRKFCGSRSDKCDKCMKFVSLMNMKSHLSSSCKWFTNKQLSTKSLQLNNKTNFIQQNMQSLSLNNNNNNDNSLFGLLKSNHSPTLISPIGYKSYNKQICPHCINDDTFYDEEEFQIHIVTKHSKLINSSMTQTIIASFRNPEILQNNNKKKKRKKRKSLPQTSLNNNNQKVIKRNRSNKKKKTKIKTKKWNCSQCTFENTFAKKKCIMCETPRSDNI